VDVDADFSEVDVGLLTILPEDIPAKSPNALNVDAMWAIVLEGTVVVDDVPNLPHAVRLPFCIDPCSKFWLPKDNEEHIWFHSAGISVFKREEFQTQTPHP